MYAAADSDVDLCNVVFFPEGNFVKTFELWYSDGEDGNDEDSTHGIRNKDDDGPLDEPDDLSWCRGVVFRVRGTVGPDQCEFVADWRLTCGHRRWSLLGTVRVRKFGTQALH